MFRRLFGRNVAMLLGIVLAGQLLAGLLVQFLVIGPQTARVADVTADMIEALSQSMVDMSPERRSAMLAELNSAHNLLVRPLADPPDDGRRFPSYIEYRFMRSLAARLTTQHRLDWITDTGDRLWVRLTLGREDYWVSLTPPRKRSAMVSLLMALGVATVIASIAGLLIQRRLDQPLRRLTAAVNDYDPDRPGTPIDPRGPPEVAALATAFNGMTRRLAGHQADRALMLGGVSHDLRTPLTRLRLSLEMMRGDDDLRTAAMRQVDRIEAMLVQFLDFARGFETETPRQTDLAALLRQIVADSGAEDVVEVVAVERLSIATRAHALSRAVSNLLANALRHGVPPVRVELSPDENGVTVIVSDAGPGMSAADSETLMRPFARGDIARGGDGAGLGLAIAQRAVGAIDGQLLFRHRDGRFEAIISFESR